MNGVTVTVDAKDETVAQDHLTSVQDQGQSRDGPPSGSGVRTIGRDTDILTASRPSSYATSNGEVRMSTVILRIELHRSNPPMSEN